MARVPKHDGVGGDVEVYVSTRRNQGVSPDGDLANNDGVCSDPHSVLQSGSALVLTTARCSDRDALTDVDVGAKHCMGTDHYTPKMTDIKPRPDASRRGNFEAIPEPVMLKQNAMIQVQEDAGTALEP